MILASPENEGVPQVLLEAMFARCPVVATRTGGIPDVVRHEETGLLVPPKNPQALAQGILEVLQSPNKSYRMDRAYEMVNQSYTIHSMGKKILDLYRLRLQEASHSENFSQD
jgi:glycosyltransferase involved in cell wall biosynthesis